MDNVANIQLCLITQQDFGRRYHIKENGLIPLLVEVQGIKGTSRGKRLANYKEGNELDGQGDLGFVYASVVVMQVTKRFVLTISPAHVHQDPEACRFRNRPPGIR